MPKSIGELKHCDTSWRHLCYGSAYNDKFYGSDCGVGLVSRICRLPIMVILCVWWSATFLKDKSYGCILTSHDLSCHNPVFLRLIWVNCCCTKLTQGWHQEYERHHWTGVVKGSGRVEIAKNTYSCRRMWGLCQDGFKIPLPSCLAMGWGRVRDPFVRIPIGWTDHLDYLTWWVRITLHGGSLRLS